MTWIDDIKRVYIEHLKDSFDRLGLKKYEEIDGPGMGALIKFKNDSFRLQIINDRGILEMGISAVHGDEQFHGIEIFNSLIKLEHAEKLNNFERRKLLGTRLDFAGQADFLLGNAERLKNLLDMENHKDTLKNIEELGRERPGYLFM